MVTSVAVTSEIVGRWIKLACQVGVPKGMIHCGAGWLALCTCARGVRAGYRRLPTAAIGGLTLSTPGLNAPRSSLSPRSSCRAFSRRFFLPRPFC